MNSKEFMEEMIEFYKVDENEFDLDLTKITCTALAFKLPSIFLQIEINSLVDTLNQKLLP